ncbi:hypothetical protein TPY_3206 [Sulfobacillus acidophilus TPY]|uniref:Mannosyl-glycoprotein endo-beta-N-acetylglucosamidase-like domain-containing protein n=1 Tax=Sulfobacillus acidophilus (strain ATCC 700253 / DSM 10332 / NAL) TaxID=679936 RepID=G8TZG3_SULAD|nr:hypothetical protein TPY_3206 [Sulfobacillus acidophilus TPY]AEW05203.1 hypothetical protein Sulac_1707 [Sulfobacillus acidophilus DSM 10332]
MPVPNSIILTWARNILDALGAPPTPANMTIMAGWIVGEHGWNWDGTGNNPMNTTWNMQAPGEHSINSVHVQAYPTAQVGLQATLNTLQQPEYAPLVQALQAGDPNAFWSSDGEKALATWGGSASYPSYLKSVVDSVSGIPSQYLAAGTVATLPSVSVQSVLNDLKAGAQSLADVLGLKQFLTGGNSQDLLIGAAIGILILVLVAEGVENV